MPLAQMLVTAQDEVARGDGPHWVRHRGERLLEARIAMGSAVGVKRKHANRG